MSEFHDLVFEPDAVGTSAETLARAMAHPLRFGKFRGQTFKDICVTSSGRSYLTWMMSEKADFPETTKMAAQVVLDFAAERLHPQERLFGQR